MLGGTIFACQSAKKRSAQVIRKAVRQQLQYIRQDLGFVVRFDLLGWVCLGKKRCALLNTLTMVYKQQLFTFENSKHSVLDRIVNIAQPWVRPIVRGKTHGNTELGAKRHISMVDGYARIERLSFDVFNETVDFCSTTEAHSAAPRI